MKRLEPLGLERVAAARQLERRKIVKEYYLETRTDVLIKNEEVFRRWRHPEPDQA